MLPYATDEATSLHPIAWMGLCRGHPFLRWKGSPLREHRVTERRERGLPLSADCCRRWGSAGDSESGRLADGACGVDGASSHEQ
jgi:hypothetical protein